MENKMKNMVTKIKRRGTLLLGSMKTKTNIATVFLGLIVVLLFSSTCSLASKNNNLRKELTETKKKHNKLASEYTKLYQISTDLNREYQVIDYNHIYSISISFFQVFYTVYLILFVYPLFNTS